MPDELPTADAHPFKDKPPLWQSAVKGRTPFLGILGMLSLAAIVVMLMLLPAPFLSVPLGQIEVEVLRVIGVVPPDEAPPLYRHLVSMPDGSEQLFTATHLFRPGDRLLVTVSRGRLSGRISLGPPYRLAAAATAAPSQGRETP